MDTQPRGHAHDTTPSYSHPVLLAGLTSDSRTEYARTLHLVRRLAVGPVPGVNDVDAAGELVELLVQEHLSHASGAPSGPLSDADITELHTAARAALDRLGIPCLHTWHNRASAQQDMNDTLDEYQNASWTDLDFSEWPVRFIRGNFAPVLEALRRLGYGQPPQRFLAIPPELLTGLSNIAPIHDHLARIHNTLETDPRAAVSAAKDLVETTAKLILSRDDAIPHDRMPVPALAKEVSLVLDAGLPRAEPGASRISGALVSLSQAVAEMRNAVGTGHGKDHVPQVSASSVRLAVNAAVTWCVYSLERWQETSQSDTPPALD